MGVHGLWELLSPVGHRVSNDSVRNKVLAVDVSIWLTQFVKAMRDAEGAQVRNAHLLGVFRRCIKLLYLSVKPVLVFDGATPALKRRTLSSRRAQREKHAAKLRRLAEKMLLNRIKRTTVDRVIAKKRKGKLRKESMLPQKSLSLRKQSKDSPRDLEEGEPMSSGNAGYERETRQLHQPSDRLTVSEEKPPGFPEHGMSLYVPYDGSDSDDAEISVPQNVDDLDDEVLLKLPTKVQAEVFKQVKLEQRARHRENMMLKRQDPSEFSKMQIEGFLRHTALNRKISRVRNVINSKSGVSQRIASDSGRNFILEEDALMGTPRGIEGRGSDVERLETSSPEEGQGDEPIDLLASIRARKEADRRGAAVARTQPPKKMHESRCQESGTAWASKVLEGNGGLLLRTRIPGDSLIASDSQLSSHSDDDSDIRLVEEQQREPRKIKDGTQAKHVILAKEPTAVDDSASDEDEWEDGDQPMQYDFSAVFGEDPVRNNEEVSKPNETSKGEEHPNLFRSLRQEPVSGKGEPDSRAPDLKQYRELRPTNETDETTACGSNQTTPKCRSDKVKADYQRFGRAIRSSSPSAAVPANSEARYNEGSEFEEHKAGKSKSALELEQTHRRDNVGEPEGSSYTLSRDDSTNSRFPMDGLQFRRQAHEHNLPGKERVEKYVSFRGPEERIDPAPSSDLAKMSKRKNEDDCINPVPSTQKGKEFVPDYKMCPSSSSVVLTEPQVKKGLNMEAAGFNVNTRSSDSCREPRRLSSSGNCDSSPELPEMGINNMDDDEQSRNKASSARSNTDYPEVTPCRPAGLNTPSTAEEMPSDIECAERHVLERSLPVQDKAPDPSFAQLETMQQELEVEAREINRQQSLHRGGADSVADEMYEETRDLVKLFGIPYLEAPMEAEAQCAFLNKEEIVDGVLTEDSDAFLFGALTVYRQLFAEGRFAESYDANDIQLSLGLDRDHLIRLAHLLGSDYTAGVRGVGIVNSMEILEAFPGSSGLEEFREWTKSVTVLDEEPEEEIMTGKSQQAVRRRFCWKHKNMKRNWEVREGFPNPAVFEAYVNPVIDNSRKRFSWGPVDFEGLANFCWDKFGWEKDRFDSAVGPLRQQLQEKSGTTQTRIDEFFKPHRFAKIKSERLQKAVHGMAGDWSKELMAANRLGHATTPSVKRRRKANPVTHSTELSDHTEELDNPAARTS